MERGSSPEIGLRELALCENDAEEIRPAFRIDLPELLKLLFRPREIIRAVIGLEVEKSCDRNDCVATPDRPFRISF